MVQVRGFHASLGRARTEPGASGVDATGAQTEASARKGRSADGFRRDIQGLRAVAVLAVALDHAGIDALSGGFVGVDVFFVVSGFLITQLLVHEAQRTGTIRLGRFYSRRARRIPPAATLVIVSTLAVASLMLDYVQMAAIVTDSVWATFFSANVKFSRDNTDYFAADNPASPLQHFWSLAVEEQFYLVWPLLLTCLVGGYAVWRQRQGRRTEGQPSGAGPVPTRWLVLTLAVIGGTSPCWSIVRTGSSPAEAYFSTFARAWELAAGACCAIGMAWILRLPVAVRAFGAWVGLAAVLMAVFTFSAQTPFPGSAALLPVLGTVLLIAGGSGRARLGPGLLLDRRPCQLLGDWSYSFYLWHWPFLLIPAAYVGHALPVSQNLVLLSAALLASVASYQLVENPFRRSVHLRAATRRGLLLYPAAVVFSLGAVVIADWAVQHEAGRVSAAPAITVRGAGNETGFPLNRSPSVAIVQASAEAARDDVAIPGQLHPALLDLASDIPGVGECDYDRAYGQLCERGVVGSDKVMVTFGDSHARQWIPALEEIALQDGYAAYYLVRSGCTSSQMVPDFGDGGFRGCLDFRPWAMAQIELLQPDVLVLASDVPPGAVGTDGQRTENDAELAELFDAGLRQTIGMLGDSVGRTIVIGNTPGIPELSAPCLAGGQNLGDCAFSVSDRSVLMLEAARDAAAATGVGFVNPRAWFCSRGLCPMVVGSTVVFRDLEHMSATYAAQLGDPLGSAFRREGLRPAADPGGDVRG